MGHSDENGVFIDTTVFYALLDPTHEAHDGVVAAWDELLRSSAKLITSSYVCAELLALAQIRLGPDSVQAFIVELRPHVETLAIDYRLHARALARGGRDLGALIPQTSRELMHQLGVVSALTLDERLLGDRVRSVELHLPSVQPVADEEWRRPPEVRPARPPRRHGARRSPRAPSPGPSTANRSPPPPARPELICRKASGSWNWEIALSVPEECNVAGVRHRGHPLQAERGEYALSSFSGELIVEYVDGTEADVVVGRARAPMIFKFANKWTGVGRRMEAVGRGHFIVIAPAGWTRTGHAPIAPEATTDPSFYAHYFFHTGGPSSDDIGFEECDLALTQAGFTLEGECVYDDSSEGKLFVGRPPELRPTPGVTWARVGEESVGGWRGENFLTTERSLADMLDHRQGRFFVRVYDSGTELRDSGEFRYVKNLREILVDGRPYTRKTLLPPTGEGHTPIKLQFVGEKGAVVRPSLNPSVHYRWVEEEASIVADPHPAADDVACTIESPSGRVGLAIKLPRIWWCLGRDRETAVWSATPMTMRRSEFRDHATSDGTVQIRLPLAFNSVDVGFDHDLSRNYRSTLTEEEARIVELRLIDFIDDSPIDGWLNKDILLRARCESSSMSIIRVLADAVPEIVSFSVHPALVKRGKRATLRWTTRNAQDGSVSISPGFDKVPRTGNITFTPKKTTRYEISIANGDRAALTRHVVVTVAQRPRKRRSPAILLKANAPQVVVFYASPAVVRLGESARLDWNTRHAQEGSVFIRPAIGGVPLAGLPRWGSVDVTPERTTRYRISIVTELGESLPRHVVVTVAQPPDKRRSRRAVKHGHQRGRRHGR